MTKEEKRNQNLMAIIKKMHDYMGETDITKARASQERVGLLSIGSKNLEIEETEIDGMKCEWIRPVKPHIRRTVILYCHGGGYITGSTLYSRPITTRLSEAANKEVFAFNYRLAPEHPYPAGLTDALKAWDYLMYRGYGAKDVIIAGDSAGGNMALALTLKLREQGRMLPAGLALMSPWTDLLCRSKTYNTKANIDPVLTREYIDNAIKCYVPEMDLADPFISPINADFKGFPPVYIQVGTNEILYGDSVMLNKKMLESNVTVKIEAFKGMWHVFQMTPLKRASEAIDKMAEFIFDQT